MAKERPDALEDSMTEMRESHRRLAALMEESNQRQDDLIHELRRVVDKLDEFRPGIPFPQPPPEAERGPYFTRAAYDREEIVSDKCARCSRYMGNRRQPDMYGVDDCDGIVQEWVAYPIRRYAPTTCSPRYVPRDR